MSDIHDEKLEALLRSRRVEAANPDLAERIIMKAQAIPQNRPASFTQWLKQSFAELHLPRPAYVLAATLIVGFVVGLSAPVSRPTDSADTANVQSFLYADEDVL